MWFMVPRVISQKRQLAVGDLTALKQVRHFLLIIIIMYASTLFLNRLFCFLLGSKRDVRLGFGFPFTLLHPVSCNYVSFSLATFVTYLYLDL